MSITIGVLNEIRADEQRVAIVPDVARRLAKQGVEIVMESGAGKSAKMPDADYEGVEFVDTAAAVFERVDVLFKVQPPTEQEIAQLRRQTIVIGFLSPHRHPECIKALRDRGITSLALEFVPRITRAQGMDALSSQAAVAGYKAVLMAANASGQFFPMLITAAGTIRPARVLVIGAGVAGLQAIATARRLGAIVEGYDVRPAAKEQVESLGAKFIASDLSAEGAGGYARELSDEEKEAEVAHLAKHIASANVVITTAAIPGKPSPRIITEEMVRNMKSGSVIIDLAAEGGGNCALTRPGKQITAHDVLIDGPLNVPSKLPVHASEMYAKNLMNLFLLMIKGGELAPDWEDEVLKCAMLTHEGRITHESIRDIVEGRS